MRVNINLDIPVILWKDVPTLYSTPLGDFTEAREVDLIQDLIEYLKRIDEIEMLINSSHQHVRFPFCRELVRDRLRFVPDNLIYYVGEKLSHFLAQFRHMTGYNFQEYEFKSRELSNGRKCHFDNWATAKTFNTEQEAISYYIKTQVSNSNFEYTEIKL